MLYDPKWDVMSVESLIIWLENQPADDEYNYPHPEQCMMGRYLTHKLGEMRSRGFTDMPHYVEIAAQEPWTFGAALERARVASQL